MAGKRNLLLALDIGTTSCKGAVYQVDGSLMAEASYSYSVQRPNELWVEQKPQDWWLGVSEVCQHLLQQVAAEDIAGIGLSGQVPTMLLIDKEGEPLNSAITWQDRRAEAEAKWLNEHIGQQQLTDWLGLELPLDAGWPPARLLWWSRHQPELIARAQAVLMAKDFILFKLTGRICSDAWSSKGIVHLLTGEAPSEYYDALNIPVAIAPEILAPYTVAGKVSAEASASIGLEKGTPVITGWSDALCGMAGTGSFQKSKIAFNLTGTSEIIGCSDVKPSPGLLHIPADVTDGIDILYGPTQSGGDSLVWLAEWTNSEIEQLIAAAAEVPPYECNLIFLPYLNGERAPIWDSDARGAFLGLLRSHELGHASRAVMEGVAMSVRHILETCQIFPSETQIVRAAGGGTRSHVWNQIRADVLGMTLEVVAQHNATTLGAAMLAAVGTGFYSDLSEAAAMVDVENVYFPSSQLRDHYDQLYKQFRTAYPVLKTVFTPVVN